MKVPSPTIAVRAIAEDRHLIGAVGPLRASDEGAVDRRHFVANAVAKERPAHAAFAVCSAGRVRLAYASARSPMRQVGVRPVVFQC